jgi:hypothetical protein
VQFRAAPKQPVPWRNRALVVALVTCAVALAIWWIREPDGKVSAPPITVPKLKRPTRHGAASAPDSIESDTVEEAPTMPVGTSELPEQLDRHQLESGMAKTFNAVERCHDVERFVGRIRVHLVINKSGNPEKVQLVEPEVRTPTTDCVVKAVHRNATFPRFRGTLLPTVELTYPFLFKEDGHLGP